MDNSESIIKHGLFWLRDNEERKLWGTLYISAANRARLETFGSLIDPDGRGLHTVVGQVESGQEWVTLIDCFPTKTDGCMWSGAGDPDWSRQTCLVNRVVVGVGFEDREEIAFEQATLGISTLPKWADPSIVKIDYAEGRTRPFQVNISVEDRADENVIVSFDAEEVKVSLRFLPKQVSERRGVLTRFSVEDHCYLDVERADGTKMPLDRILSVAGAMLDLLSICCNEASTVTSFSVRYEKGQPDTAQLYVPMKGSEAEGSKSSAFPALNLKGLGGMEGLGRWIAVRERFGVAVALLTSNWYNEKAYNEDKFSRMYTAVEGLLARKRGRGAAQMKHSELATFVEDAIPGFSSIAGRPPGDWAKSVKDMRDQKISHLDPTSTIVTDGRTMHVMTNVLYVAGACFLLREMGVPEEQVGKYVKECSGSLLLREHW